MSTHASRQDTSSGELKAMMALRGSADRSQTTGLVQKFTTTQNRSAVAPLEGVTPSAVHEVIHSKGVPLDADVRSNMETRFGHDFSHVRVHTGTRAAESARDIHALAYTVGPSIVFGAGQYSPRTEVGRHLLAHELTHVVQQGRHMTPPARLRVACSDEVSEKEAQRVSAVDEEQTSSASAQLSKLRGPLTIQRQVSPGEPEEEPVEEKSDRVLGSAIFEHEQTILEAWSLSLDIFDKVMSSVSDKETKPGFQKVIGEFFRDKVIGVLLAKSKVPLAGDAFALLQKLEAEIDRAGQARETATLRDFFVQHKESVFRLKIQLTGLKDDFETRVERASKLAIEQGKNIDEYGMMRLNLVETFEDVDRRLKASSPEYFFRLLSEEWIRQTSLPGPLGMRLPGVVVIHVEAGAYNFAPEGASFAVRGAKILAPGGQKIADQLLRASPEGVDVFGLKARRTVLYYSREEKTFPMAQVKLDENNNLLNEGSFAEGNYGPIFRALIRKGLPRTKNLSGE